MKLIEKNALQRYFEKHPEKIRNFGFEFEKYDNSWEEFARDLFRENPISEKRIEIENYFKNNYPREIYNFLIYRNLESKINTEDFKKENKEIYELYWDKFINDPNLKNLNF